MKITNKAKTLLSILLFPLAELLRRFVAVVPRKRDLWVFGSYVNSFTDNSKYLYTYVTEKHPEIRAVWISSDTAVIERARAGGGYAYHRWSVAGILCAIRAKYWFVSAYVSDINVHLSRGSCLVNLWHGIPLKKIEFDIENGPLARRFHFPTLLERFVTDAHLFRRPEWVLSTSDYVSKVSFASAFRVKLEQCLPFGYPRLDPFFWDEETRDSWLKKWGSKSQISLIEKMSKFNEVVIYMPTWRDSNPNFLSKSGIDFAELNEDLKTKNSLLVLKLHVATPMQELEPLGQLSNIHLMDTRDDMYPLLSSSDALVTDYSSIYLDYLLLDRSICFFVFDLERYLSENRGFYYDFSSLSPGVKVTSGEKVAEFIANRPVDAYRDERQILTEKLHGKYSGDAAGRLVEFFMAK